MLRLQTRIVRDDEQKNTAEAAFKKAVRLIEVRERSVCEMRDRLMREGFTEANVSNAIERAIVFGLLDDSRFTGAYIKGKLSSGWGFERIERGLITFGVDIDAIEGYPEAFTSREDEVDRALKELARFKTSAKDVRGARYRRLFSKGFSSSVIQTAITRFENDDCY